MRVAGVARRFPSAGAQFAIVDERALSALLDADAPGSGTPDELWLPRPRPRSTRSSAGSTARAFAGLERTSRRTLTDEQLSDPLARAILWALAVTALLALLLALVAVALVAAGDLADERGELFDLEAQGADPADLRAQLRIARRAARWASASPAGSCSGSRSRRWSSISSRSPRASRRPIRRCRARRRGSRSPAARSPSRLLAAAAVELVVRRGFRRGRAAHGAGELA